MIKVNLLTNKVDQADSTRAVTSMIEAGSQDGNREIMVKGLVMFLFTGGLMLWESQSIRALNEERNRLMTQQNQLQQVATDKAAEADKFKDVEAQAKELEDKLKILKLLSKLRLREVKTLDFVQTSIPEKVWLKTVNFEADSTKLENGHFKVVGNAVTTDDLTEFVRRLESGAYLQDVIVIRNQEVPAAKNSTIRDFMFTAEVEHKN